MNFWNRMVYIFILLALVCGSREQKKTVQKNDFTLKSLDNTTYTLSGLKGKVVLIDFWATWCAPCRSSIPIFKKLYNKYKDSGFIVLGVGLDNKKALKNFQAQLQIPYPILLGTKEVAKAYNVQYIPTMILYDRNGKVVKREVGLNPELEVMLDALVDSLLSQ